MNELMFQNCVNNTNTNLDMGIQTNGRVTREIVLNPWNGCIIFTINIILFFIGIGFITLAFTVFSWFYFTEQIVFLTFGSLFVIIPIFLFLFGFHINNPNEARVITSFGKYLGTIKVNGIFWMNPFRGKRKISLKSNSLNGDVIKVNDKTGNSIMLSCAVVWRVNDTAKACFDVEDYHKYVANQSESALRYVGCMYPYDKEKTMIFL